MEKAEYEKLLEELYENELFKKSKSVHKRFQFCQFKMSGSKDYVQGQQVRKEDAHVIPYGEEGYDENTGRLVIYNFKNGMIDSDGDKPAIEYPGHYEIWHEGMIEKVWANGGDTIEYWENGVPVRIENNLFQRTEDKQ